MSLSTAVMKRAAQWVLAGEGFVPQIETIVGREMVRMPNLFYVRGAADLADAPPVLAFVRSFWIDVRLVSRRVYAEVTGAGSVADDVANLPAIASWNDALAYHKKLAGAVGRKWEIGLPAEVEWEAAASGPMVNARTLMEQASLRGDDIAGLRRLAQGRFDNVLVIGPADDLIDGARVFALGDEAVGTAVRGRARIFLGRQFSTVDGSSEGVWFYPQSGPRSVLAGVKGPSGTEDMSGNVWERCLDAYRPDAYLIGSTRRPLVPTLGATRVVRGGSYVVDAGGARVACRDCHSPGDVRYDYLGFRSVVRPRTLIDWLRKF